MPKPVAGTVINLALAMVDVANNPLDVSLNTTMTAGIKSLNKLTDDEYLPGYGRTEHTSVSTTLPPTPPTSPESGKMGTEKTSYFEDAKPSMTLSTTSTVVTGAKSRTVPPNDKTHKKIDNANVKVAK